MRRTKGEVLREGLRNSNGPEFTGCKRSYDLESGHQVNMGNQSKLEYGHKM